MPSFSAYTSHKVHWYPEVPSDLITPFWANIGWNQTSGWEYLFASMGSGLPNPNLKLLILLASAICSNRFFSAFW
jgi:hypothetical protein